MKLLYDPLPEGAERRFICGCCGSAPEDPLPEAEKPEPLFQRRLSEIGAPNMLPMGSLKREPLELIGDGLSVRVPTLTVWALVQHMQIAHDWEIERHFRDFGGRHPMLAAYLKIRRSKSEYLPRKPRSLNTSKLDDEEMKEVISHGTADSEGGRRGRSRSVRSGYERAARSTGVSGPDGVAIFDSGSIEATPELALPADWSARRRKCFQRDGYKCQLCFRKLSANKLNAHHIIPRSEGGHNEQSNLITLCAEAYAPWELSCHDQVEHADPPARNRAQIISVSRR